MSMGDTTELARSSEATAGPTIAGALTIVVADRGHVWVGYVVDEADGDWLTIGRARVIRRWGSSEGLNQLANGGPRPQTKLDEAATVKVARKAVIALIPCEVSAWPNA